MTAREQYVICKLTAERSLTTSPKNAANGCVYDMMGYVDNVIEMELFLIDLMLEALEGLS